MNKVEEAIYNLNLFQASSAGTEIPSLGSEYTEAGLNKILKEWYDILFCNQDKIDELLPRIEKFETRSSDYVRDIKTRLAKASSDAKAANVADRSVTKYTKAVYYSPSSISYIEEETTAYVDGGKIVGVKESDTFNSDSHVISNNTSSGISCYVFEDNKKVDLVWTVDGGAAQSRNVLNSNVNSTISYSSLNGGTKSFVLDIDRKEYGVFNNIQLKTKRAYVYTIYTSNDSINYNRITDRILTNSLNESIGETNDRYVRIVIELDKNSDYVSGRYIYNVEISSFHIAVKRYSTPTEYVTGDIPIRATGEFVAIDTCDNYQSKNVDMHYQISINGGAYKDIKPLRKLSKTGRSIRSILPINDYSDNNIVTLHAHIRHPDGNIFTTEIDPALLETNIFKYYDATNPISVKGNVVSASGIAISEKVINFKDTYFVNGVPFSGESTIYTGFNSLSFPADNYVEIYDVTKYTLVSFNSGEFRVADAAGVEQTIIAEDWEKNPFTSIVLSLKYILGRELGYGKDINTSKSKNGYQLKTSEDVKSLYVAARQKNAIINTARIKIKMKTLDGYTKPNVSRILIKVA
jgi:hypothetical protein